jgi:membrane protein implicated in regulation of membrane protease activity
MNAGVTVTAGKFIGRIGVLDGEARDGWVRVLLVGETWPVEIRTAHLAARV